MYRHISSLIRFLVNCMALMPISIKAVRNHFKKLTIAFSLYILRKGIQEKKDWYNFKPRKNKVLKKMRQFPL
jgi:hypothetical protein